MGDKEIGFPNWHGFDHTLHWKKAAWRLKDSPTQVATFKAMKKNGCHLSTAIIGGSRALKKGKNKKPGQELFQNRSWISYSYLRLCFHILSKVFLSISEDVFILTNVFFSDSRRCFWRPKLSILYSMYPARVIYLHMYIYIIHRII